MQEETQKTPDNEVEELKVEEVKEVKPDEEFKDEDTSSQTTSDIYADPKPRRKRRKKKPKKATSKKKKSIDSDNKEPDFNDFQKEWEDRLDGDTKKEHNKDNIDEGEKEIEDNDEPDDPTDKKKKSAKELTPESLVAFCNIIMPLLAVIFLRILSKNKKRRPPAYFRYEEFETDLLTQLADGAAEELEGKANKTVLFGIALVAITAMQVMDAYDETPNIETNTEPEITVDAETIPQPQ